MAGLAFYGTGFSSGKVSSVNKGRQETNPALPVVIAKELTL
ncbi:hypothetical protein LCGC14_2873120, partial [marine sediment metagenome]